MSSGVLGLERGRIDVPATWYERWLMIFAGATSIWAIVRRNKVIVF